jgi:hypothetical protein
MTVDDRPTMKKDGSTTTRGEVIAMPNGWYPREPRRDAEDGPHRDLPVPVVPARGHRRAHGPEVLQIDCFGVYVAHASVLQRLECHLLGDRLDRTLAAGIAPETDVLLALRAQRLACTTSRRELARSLLRILDAAAEPATGLNPHASMAILPRVTEHRRDIESLVDHLLAPVPLAARGVALVRLLLRDGTGPLYRYESKADLGEMVRRVTSALDPVVDWPA